MKHPDKQLVIFNMWQCIPYDTAVETHTTHCIPYNIVMKLWHTATDTINNWTVCDTLHPTWQYWKCTRHTVSHTI